MGGALADIGNSRGVIRGLGVKPEKKNLLENLGVDGSKILRWTFRKWDLRAWTGSMWLRIGTGGWLW